MLTMNNTHTRTWDVVKETCPSDYIAVPSFSYASKAFDDSLVISIHHENPKTTIFYYLNEGINKGSLNFSTALGLTKIMVISYLAWP